MGLLDGLFSQDPQSQGILALASGLLSNRGNFGQNAGQSMQQGQQAFNVGMANQRQDQYRQAQEQRLQAQAAWQQAQADRANAAYDQQQARESQVQDLASRSFSSQEMGPPDANGGMYTQENPNGPRDFVRGLAGIDYKAALPYLADRLGGQSNVPGPIQEYKFYQGLPTQEDKNVYMDIKRQNYKVTDVGGVPSVVTTGTNPRVVPISTLPAEVQADVQKAAGKAQGGAVGAAAGAAQVALPTIENSSAYMINLLDRLKGDPGLKYTTGALSKLPTIPGSQQAATRTLLDQIKGKQFLQAYNDLRGGGQITEVEGEKATEALARLNTAQTAEDVRAAASEFQEQVSNLTAIARQKASMGVSGGMDSLPLPEGATAKTLKKGQKYQTQRGVATWNGMSFEQ